MRVKIIPHGILKKLMPLGFECEARTPFEALNAVSRQFLSGKNAGLNKCSIQIAGCPTIASIYSPLQWPELHIMPAFCGGGGLVKVIVGAVLIIAAVAAVAFGGVAAGGLMATALGGVFSVGMSLVLGGILEMLSPYPNPKNQYVSPSGGSFSGVPNTAAMGTYIAIGYGRFAVGGQYLSIGVEADPGSWDSQPQSTRTDLYLQGSNYV